MIRAGRGDWWGRAIGIENELCVACEGLRFEDEGYAATALGSIIIQEFPDGGKQWIPNGSRVYADTSGIEVATPECVTPRQLVAIDEANMRWLGQQLAAIDVLSVLQDNDLKKYPVHIRAFKANSDGRRGTVGTHENYQLFRRAILGDYQGIWPQTEEDHFIFRYLNDTLTPFLVTRQLFAGAGGILAWKNSWQYTLSQRSHVIESPLGNQTTSERPIINTRTVNEPLADKEEYMRLHLICGDANMSQYATWLKVGTTSIVLSLIEHLRKLPVSGLIDPVSDIHQVSYDHTGKKHILEFRDGSRRTAIGVQRLYRDLVEKHLLPQLNAPMREVFAEWSRTIDDIAREGPLALTDRLDHALKNELLTSAQKRRPARLTVNEARGIHLNYHSIMPDSIYPKLAKRTHHGIIDDATLERHTKEPPMTRAAARRRLVDGLHEQGWRPDENWDGARLVGTRLCLPNTPEGQPLRISWNGPTLNITMTDPRVACMEDVERTLKRVGFNRGIYVQDLSEDRLYDGDGIGSERGVPHINLAEPDLQFLDDEFDELNDEREYELLDRDRIDDI